MKKSFRNSYVFLVWHNITYVKYPQSQGGFVLKGRAHDIQLQFYFITGALNVRQTPWIGEPAGVTKHYGCYRGALRRGVGISASILGNDRRGEQESWRRRGLRGWTIWPGGRLWVVGSTVLLDMLLAQMLPPPSANEFLVKIQYKRSVMRNKAG